MNASRTRLIWLSHVLSPTTPLYGGAKDLRLTSLRSISAGDSCNATMINLPSHAGTHIDSPYHFLPDGRTLDTFPAEFWIFSSPALAVISLPMGSMIGPGELPTKLTSNVETDLLLLKTGGENNRQYDVYWREGFGLSASLAGHLKSRYPRLRAVGVDFISISSWGNREEGRIAHRAFLEKDILLIEDMSLREIGDGDMLRRVVALPLRFEGADGAPCSILGWVDGI